MSNSRMGRVLPDVPPALPQQQDQVLARRCFPATDGADSDEAARDDTIQLIDIAPGAAPPCHCHHDVASTLVLLTGALYARAFDPIPSRSD